MEKDSYKASYVYLIMFLIIVLRAAGSDCGAQLCHGAGHFCSMDRPFRGLANLPLCLAYGSRN